MRPWPLLLLAAPLLSACLGSDAGGTDLSVRAGAPARAADLLAGAPPIAWDVAASVDWWEGFAAGHAKRDAYTPESANARAAVVAELERIGLQVEVREYAFSSAGVDGPDAVPARKYAIVGTKQGTDLPGERIALVSHYDTNPLTIQGAYDNAAGVASELAVCEALAKVPMRRTLSCVFFDAEEHGLEASRAYVEDVVVAGDEGYVHAFVVGFDMTGINWPGHDWKMYVMTGPADHVPLLGDFARDVMHGVLAYPEEGVEVLDVHDRNSDERRFREAGVPIYRFAGGRHAADYPAYHLPHDTVDFVYGYVGGRADFEAGFATIVEGAYALVLALDGTDLAGMDAAYGAA